MIVVVLSYCGSFKFNIEKNSNLWISARGAEYLPLAPPQLVTVTLQHRLVQPSLYKRISISIFLRYTSADKKIQASSLKQ